MLMGISKIVLCFVFLFHNICYCYNEYLFKQSVVYGISVLARESNVSSKCFEELGEFGQAVDEDHVWGIKVLDASGQANPGFLYGNNLWLGSSTECFDISNRKPLEVNNLKIKHAAETPFDYPPYDLGFSMALIKHNSTLQLHTQMPLEFIIQIGLCLPKSCSSDEGRDLLKIYFEQENFEFQKLHHLHLNVVEVRNIHYDVGWLLVLPKTIILMTILGTILMLVIVGTLYDVVSHKRSKNLGRNTILTPNNNKQTTTESTTELVLNSNNSLNQIEDSSSTLLNILKCFSLYSNTKALVKTTLSTHSVKCIHGLKFFGMGWVIMVHAIFFAADYVDNVPVAFRLSESIAAQIFSNSTFCVDTYLVLSGFLVGYLFFTLKKSSDNSFLYKVGSYFLMLLNRLLRLTPTYFIVILLTDVVFTYFRQASVFYSNDQPDVVCSKYWWRNLLYINNLFPRSEMCLSWSWYLSLDIQAYVICSFLLILSTSYFKTSASITVGLIFVNIFMSGYNSYSVGYIPTMDEQMVQLDTLYDLPWLRMGPYLVGIITAYFLVVRLQGKLYLRERTRILIWITSSALNLWVLMTLYTRDITVEFTAFYMGIARTLWGVTISWMIIACCTGNARALEKFLSFKGFVPLSRLTYSAYLLNPLVAEILYLSGENSINVSNSSMTIVVAGVLLTTFLVSFIFSMIFESPFILLTRMLFVKFINKKGEKEQSHPQVA